MESAEPSGSLQAESLFQTPVKVTCFPLFVNLRYILPPSLRSLPAAVGASPFSCRKLPRFLLAPDRHFCEHHFIMKPSEIRNVLEDHEVRPSKSLGQNFLTDENVARWIAEQLEIRPQDCVVEVGPGTGSLTEHAAPLCRKLVLVEFDSRLAEYQKERWAGDPHVEVHHADGASWDPRGLFAEAPVKFLGNLPYSAGGAILQNFLSRPSAVERAVVMLQKEFIDRILATPDDDAFGLLSLRIQKNWIPRALKTIPPEAFHPRPRIDSTVMLLTPRPARELPPYDDRLMDELMRKAFSQRRKQLKKQLPASPPWEGVAASLGLSPSARAEELNLSQWVELARVYDTNPLKDVAQSGDELFDIVDELNQVTGQGTRREIHEGSLRHRAVHMFLVNKHGAVLLQKRSLWKDRQPGKWDSSAAGHLDAGESYEEAAVRELKEELGVSGCGLQKIADFDAGENNGWEFISLYEGRYSGKVRFPAAEVDSVQWFTPEQIQAWVERRPQDFSPAFIPCWNAWLAANRKNHSNSNTYHDKP